MTTIIKVTRWYLNSLTRNPMLRKGQFVYGELRSDGRWDVLLTPRGERFYKRVRAKTTDNDNEHRNWCLDPDEDEWEVIPEDQWPDEVYAALAKQALLGEDERVNDD